jgi:hypothetical protein
MPEVSHSQFKAFVQEVRTALLNVYAELHQVSDRLEDVSIFEKKAEFAADMAGTATIGVSELRGIIDRAHARGARSVKLWVAILGSVSVLGSAAFTASTSRANARLRAECAEVARQEIEHAELRNEARDARLAQKAADWALQARDRQLELLIKAGVK